MSKFDKALEIVHEALRRIQENSGNEIRVSKNSLAKLVNTKSPQKKSALEEAHKESTKTMPPSPAPGGSTNKAQRMDALRARALVCEKCAHLVKSTTQVVFGVGNID